MDPPFRSQAFWNRVAITPMHAHATMAEPGSMYPAIMRTAPATACGTNTIADATFLEFTRSLLLTAVTANTLHPVE